MYGPSRRAKAGRSWAIRMARMLSTNFPGRRCRLTRQGSLITVHLSGSCKKGMSRTWSMVRAVQFITQGEQLVANTSVHFFVTILCYLEEVVCFLARPFQTPMPFGKYRVLRLNFGEKLEVDPAAARFRKVKIILWRGANRGCRERSTMPSFVSRDGC